METSQTQMVSLTPLAVTTIMQAMKEEGFDGGGHGLRIAVRGGGCAGLEYALDFETNQRSTDYVYEQDGLKLFIDFASLQFLKGTSIDYIQGVNGSGFKFNNPNARRTCGCGHSFE